MTLIPLNAAVIGLVALVTLGLMIYWHRATVSRSLWWPGAKSEAKRS